MRRKFHALGSNNPKALYKNPLISLLQTPTCVTCKNLLPLVKVIFSFESHTQDVVQRFSSDKVTVHPCILCARQHSTHMRGVAKRNAQSRNKDYTF